MTTTSNILSGTSASTAATTASAAAASNVGAATAKEASDRFLKLLVTQLKNQDPLNPMDNAQMTSQMAQISTVSGIEKLNSSVVGLNTQFVQMQALQGASLVGKGVIIKGDQISIASGAASGMFQLDSAATAVKAEVLNAAGQVVDTLNLGAQTLGRHEFNWPGGSEFTEADGYSFRISATSGTTALSSTTLMKDHVSAVNTSGASLTLELARSGNVAYAAVQALN